MRALIRRLGYLCIAGIFIKGGSDGFLHPGHRVAIVARAGIPEPERAVRANGAAMALGGAMLVLGFAPRLAAVILTASIVPTTAVGHAFWQAEGESRKQHQTQFFKNLGLLGGLLLILAE